MMNKRILILILFCIVFSVNSICLAYPGIPQNEEIFICVLTLILGFGIIKYISSKDV